MWFVLEYMLMLFQIMIRDDSENESTGHYTNLEEAPMLKQHSTNGNDYTFGRTTVTAKDQRTPKENEKDSWRPRDTNGFQQHTYAEEYSLGKGSELVYERNSQSKLLGRPTYEKFAQRSILLSNLPEGVTHADIVEVVRGGMLLDM